MSEIQKAIEYFKYLKRQSLLFPYSFNVKIEYFDLAISALQEQAEMGKRNKPLTLGQLRKMDGKLVWIVCKNINAPPCLMSVQNFNSRCATEDKEYYELFADYGKTWLAYARKPVSK